MSPVSVPLFVTVPSNVALPEHIIEPVVSDITTSGTIFLPSARDAAEAIVSFPVPSTSSLKLIPEALRV